MDNLTVRTGDVADIDAMMQLALSACKENGMADPDPKKLLTEIYSSLALHHGICGVIGKDPIEAAVLLRVESMWYARDDDPSIIERAVFVAPEFRAAKGGRARLLIEWSKDVARQMNRKLFMGILTNDKAEAKVRLYRRQFGEPDGGYWVFDPSKETGTQ